MPAVQFQTPFPLEKAREGISLIAENDAAIAAQIELLRKSIAAEVATQYTNPQDYADFVISEILGVSVGDLDGSIGLLEDFSATEGKTLESVIPHEIRKLAAALVEKMEERIGEESASKDADPDFYLHLAYRVALCHQNGIGVEKDAATAEEMMKSLAKAGHPQIFTTEQKLVAALAFESGDGIEQDKKRAFRLFSEAAREGSGDAMMHLSFCFLTGGGTKRDYQQGLLWYSRGIKHGGKHIADFELEAADFSKDQTIEIIGNLTKNLEIARRLFLDPEAGFIKSLIDESKLSFQDLVEIRNRVAILPTLSTEKPRVPNPSLVYLEKQIAAVTSAFSSPLTAEGKLLEGSRLTFTPSLDCKTMVMEIPYHAAIAANAKLGVKAAGTGLTASVKSSKTEQFEELAKHVAGMLGIRDYTLTTDTAERETLVSKLGVTTHYVSLSFPIENVRLPSRSPSDAIAALSGKALGGAGSR